MLSKHVSCFEDSRTFVVGLGMVPRIDYAWLIVFRAHTLHKTGTNLIGTVSSMFADMVQQA